MYLIYLINPSFRVGFYRCFNIKALIIIIIIITKCLLSLSAYNLLDTSLKVFVYITWYIEINILYCKIYEDFILNFIMLY